MILRIGGMGMDEESIRQDRELARAAIKGLTSYAEQIAHQGKDEEIVLLLIFFDLKLL